MSRLRFPFPVWGCRGCRPGSLASVVADAPLCGSAAGRWSNRRKPSSRDVAQSSSLVRRLLPRRTARLAPRPHPTKTSLQRSLPH